MTRFAESGPLTRPERRAVEPVGPPVLQVRGVSKRFNTRRSDTLALSDINLDVAEGEFVCVVGPSGCGKSTLLNVVAGFEAPDSGEVLTSGTPIRGAGPDRVVVFQEAALFPWMNVRANIEFGLKLAGVGRQERQIREWSGIQQVIEQLEVFWPGWSGLVGLPLDQPIKETALDRAGAAQLIDAVQARCFHIEVPQQGLALPLVWMHPRYDISRKILVTVIVLIVTYALMVAMGHAVDSIMSSYKQLSGVL